MNQLTKLLFNGDGEIKWKNLFYTALGVWVAYAVLSLVYFQDLGKAGQFGDMFGGVNALFSGLALIGVVVAIFYQRSELKLQRKELELTRQEMECQREELRGQKEVMSKQYESMAIQKFENSFYQMLKAHNDLIAMMYDYTDEEFDESVTVGNALFEFAYNKMNKNFWRGHEIYFEQLMPYLFRVETILQYIDNSKIHPRDLYVQIFRSNFTACEVKIIKLFENNDIDDFQKMYTLMYQYDFFDMLDYDN